MHVVIFTSLYPRRKKPHSGVFVQQQVRALAQASHCVTVIAPEFARLSEVLEQPCVVEEEEQWLVFRPRCWYVRGVWWLPYLVTSFSCSRQIDWSTVDIIHAHCAIPSGFTAALLSHRYRKPFVMTEHTGRFASLVKPCARRLPVRWTVQEAQRVMIVSQALRRRIEAEGIKGEFVVVPNIVDPSIFHPDQLPDRNINIGDEDSIHLLWVGSFKPIHYRNKGVPELLESVAILDSQIEQQVRLILIGDGAAKTDCEAQAKDLGIADRCAFIGRVPHAQMARWMNRCDALVLASHNESFGVVLIEAMACGKPVVATRCGGPEDIVTPETGVLVEPGDSEALADGIADLIENYGAFDAAEITAYARANFSPERVVHILTETYTEARRSF
jgi:glycosyltransferase involved in cell wall biosynthesis